YVQIVKLQTPAGQTENSSDNPRRFLRFPIGRFERLEQSAVVERLERAAVIGERLNKSLDLPLVQPLFANIVCVRLTDHEFQFFATQCFEECLNASHRLLYLMGRWW